MVQEAKDYLEERNYQKKCKEDKEKETLNRIASNMTIPERSNRKKKGDSSNDLRIS